MPQLKLQPDPTFWCKVPIRIPGQDEPAILEIEYKHRDKLQFEEFTKVNNESKVNDAKAFMNLAKSWKLPTADGQGVEPFTEEVIAKFLSNYQGAGRAVANKYVEELMQVRLGN